MFIETFSDIERPSENMRWLRLCSKRRPLFENNRRGAIRRSMRVLEKILWPARHFTPDNAPQ